jgi:hypothetical protein
MTGPRRERFERVLTNVEKLELMWEVDNMKHEDTKFNRKESVECKDLDSEWADMEETREETTLKRTAKEQVKRMDKISIKLLNGTTLTIPNNMAEALEYAPCHTSPQQINSNLDQWISMENSDPSSEDLTAEAAEWGPNPIDPILMEGRRRACCAEWITSRTQLL